jgi:hypothetical protein
LSSFACPFLEVAQLEIAETAEYIVITGGIELSVFDNNHAVTTMTVFAYFYISLDIFLGRDNNGFDYRREI